MDKISLKSLVLYLFMGVFFVVLSSSLSYAAKTYSEHDGTSAKTDVKEAAPKTETKVDGGGTNTTYSSHIGGSGCSNASNPFETIACKAMKTLIDLRKIIYVIAGFGIIVFTYGAIFNKINWNHLASIGIGLFLVSMMVPFISYFAVDAGKQQNFQKWGDHISSGGHINKSQGLGKESDENSKGKAPIETDVPKGGGKPPAIDVGNGSDNGKKEKDSGEGMSKENADDLSKGIKDSKDNVNAGQDLSGISKDLANTGNPSDVLSGMGSGNSSGGSSSSGDSGSVVIKGDNSLYDEKLEAEKEAERLAREAAIKEENRKKLQKVLDDYKAEVNRTK